MNQSQCHMRKGCGPRGVWRQRCSKSFQASKRVTMYNVLMHGEIIRAVYGLASQLWVPSRAGCVGVRCSVFAP
eukprot:1157565-Pelagomonas_calceolata.AAC.3